MSKYLIEDTTLTDIANAIRSKTETVELINPADMAPMIEGIIAGGGEGPPAAAFVLTGDCSYRFSHGGWDWFVEQYGNQITTKNILNLVNMFAGSNLEDIPFDVNIGLSSQVSIDNVFSNCKKLKNIPNINNLKPASMPYLFKSCQLLREIPDSFCNTWDWSYIESQTGGYTGNTSGMFGGCHSLRKIPRELISHINPNIVYSYNICYNGFSDCYALDEISDLVVPNKAIYTSNAFSGAFNYCCHLKKLTFKTNEDGTPITVQWKSQIIDLSTNVGYTRQASYITNYNSGLTTATQINDDATYQALKDNPDNWTTNINYSRYNRTSAVETINSLPDTSAYLASAGGTNTIKFKGASGALTDGGAINTMTEAEIAVAAAKGWTVSFA